MGEKIVITKPGMLTTVQDLGREGFMGAALSRGGALDTKQMIYANLLVGNEETDAGLEITGLGPSIHFSQSTCIAVCGATINANLLFANGKRNALPLNRPVIAPAGSTVQLSECRFGFRAWMAFAGGLDTPTVLKSRSSHLAAEVGLPRIAANTEIALGENSKKRTAYAKARALQQTGNADNMFLTHSWSLKSTLPIAWPRAEILAIKGRHFHLLPSDQQAILLEQRWKIDARSNRQGIALAGNPIDTEKLPSILSEPVRFGTVQLPPGGKPYILLGEHQTTGGYPKILEIIQPMRPLLAQLAPGCELHFKVIDFDHALNVGQKSEREFSLIRDVILEKLKTAA